MTNHYRSLHHNMIYLDMCKMIFFYLLTHWIKTLHSYFYLTKDKDRVVQKRRPPRLVYYRRSGRNTRAPRYLLKGQVTVMMLRNQVWKVIYLICCFLWFFLFDECKLLTSTHYPIKTVVGNVHFTIEVLLVRFTPTSQWYLLLSGHEGSEGSLHSTKKKHTNTIYSLKTLWHWIYGFSHLYIVEHPHFYPTWDSYSHFDAQS